jgi:hypothetical protein
MELLAFVLVIVLSAGIALSVARFLMGILLTTMMQQRAIHRASTSLELR